MYSLEERVKAVTLYIESNLDCKVVYRSLGYPSPNALRGWHKEYLEKGSLKKKRKKTFKFTKEQKQNAVNHYLENGMNFTQTSRALGYPNRNTLREWVEELSPKSSNQIKSCVPKSKLVGFNNEKKQEAVEKWLSGEADYKLSSKYNVSRATLFNWKEELLCRRPVKMNKKDLEKLIEDLPTDKEELQKMVKQLRKEVYQLSLEKDVLEKATEILKKGIGVNLKSLTNKEKAELIGALKTTYKLKDLLSYLNISKSSYFYQQQAMLREDKYKELRLKVRAIFEENNSCYGYRRIHAELKKESIRVSEKVIRRMMAEDCLATNYNKRRRKYSSYLGEINPARSNLLKRDFKTNKPNNKWVTDLTEFALPSGKVYLSPIVDCFDGSIVSWNIGTNPTAKLVNTMLERAVAKLPKGESPILHSDRGCHYQWPAWIKMVEEAGIIRSMSKKGCTADNAACEGFFGTIKNEMFYNKDWMGISTEQFIKILDQYLHWFNNKRIKQSLDYLSPFEYRQRLGIAI